MVLVFAGVILMPFTLYVYVAHPAWAWMYIVDPAKVPGLAVVPLLFFHAGVLVAGWYVGARVIKAGKPKLVAYMAGGGAFSTLVLTAIAWGRIGQYGSYEQYWDGRAVALMEHKLGFVLVAMALGGAVAAGFVAVELNGDSRRVRAR